MGLFKRKKKKLSDEVVLQKWGKKPMQFIANDQKVTVEPIPVTKEEVNAQINLEDYHHEFEQQTGKHAMWGGKETKQFLNWKTKYET